ncbi:MAG: hypothetical protein JOZ41_03955 [Chloroflexi bacterium]|nr:hypothetical protein [Chloroflexota bacterium]
MVAREGRRPHRSDVGARLGDLMERLGGPPEARGWRTKFPDEWTGAEEAEYERLVAAMKKGDREAEKRILEWWEWLIHVPITVVYLEPGREPPAEKQPRMVYIPCADAAFVAEMEGRGPGHG